MTPAVQLALGEHPDDKKRRRNEKTAPPEKSELLVPKRKAIKTADKKAATKAKMSGIAMARKSDSVRVDTPDVHKLYPEEMQAMPKDALPDPEQHAGTPGGFRTLRSRTQVRVAKNRGRPGRD